MPAQVGGINGQTGSLGIGDVTGAAGAGSPIAGGAPMQAAGMTGAPMATVPQSLPPDVPQSTNPQQLLSNSTSELNFMIQEGYLNLKGNEPLWMQGTQGVEATDYALASQFIGDYETGQLPQGTQDAINQAYTSGEASLTSQLSSEGINPQGSTQYLGGIESLQQQKSIATQNALNELLQNAFQAQGLSLQAAGMLEQYNEFEQELMFQYAELAVQQQEFQQQQSQAAKGQAGSMAGSLGGLFGGIKSIIAAAIIGASNGFWF